MQVTVGQNLVMSKGLLPSKLRLCSSGGVPSLAWILNLSSFIILEGLIFSLIQLPVQVLIKISMDPSPSSGTEEVAGGVVEMAGGEVGMMSSLPL